MGALHTSVTCLPSHPRSVGLQPFMYGDYIAYDCWLGKVYDLKNQIILKLSNGARYAAQRTGPRWAGAAWGGGRRRCFLPGPVMTCAAGAPGLTLGWSPFALASLRVSARKDTC